MRNRQKERFSKKLASQHRRTSDWERLAAVPEDQFEAVLATPVKPSARGILNQTIKKAARSEREAELAAKQFALPDKRYGVILADPEWRFEPWSRETGMDRAATAKRQAIASVDATLVVETVEPGSGEGDKASKKLPVSAVNALSALRYALDEAGAIPRLRTTFGVRFVRHVRDSARA